MIRQARGDAYVDDALLDDDVDDLDVLYDDDDISVTRASVGVGMDEEDTFPHRHPPASQVESCDLADGCICVMHDDWGDGFVGDRPQ